MQGASAAHNAANASAGGYNAAGSTVTQAGKDANAGITSAIGGVNSAVTGAQTGSTAAGNASMAGVTAAGTAAGTGAVSAAQGAAAGVDPYAATGAQAARTLGGLMAPGGQLNTPQTAAQIMQNDPGYAFQLQQGEQAIARANAASGTTGSGGQDKALVNYAINSAQSGYQQAFQDSTTSQQNLYNNLSGLAQQGQAAAQYQGNVGTQGAQYAGTTGIQTAENAGATGTQVAEYGGSAGLSGAQMGLQGAEQQGANTLTAGEYTGNTQIGAGNAIASGDIGAANSWNGMLSGIGSAANSLVTGGFNLGGLGKLFTGGGGFGNGSASDPWNSGANLGAG